MHFNVHSIAPPPPPQRQMQNGTTRSSTSPPLPPLPAVHQTQPFHQTMSPALIPPAAAAYPWHPTASSSSTALPSAHPPLLRVQPPLPPAPNALHPPFSHPNVVTRIHVAHPLPHPSNNPLKKLRAPPPPAPMHTAPISSTPPINNAYPHPFNRKPPLTSPVSTATLPNLNLKCPARSFKRTARTAEDISTPSASPVAHPAPHAPHPHLPPMSPVKPTLANSIMWHASQSPPIPTSTATPSLAPHRSAAAAAAAAGAAAAAAAAAATTKSVANNRARSKSRRKSTNGPPIPVHLRNPKKGRARVFRQCNQCAADNHIRRSVCVACRAALPPGKRRREANPVYTRAHPPAAPAAHALAHNKHQQQQQQQQQPHASGAPQLSAPDTLPLTSNK